VIDKLRSAVAGMIVTTLALCVQASDTQVTGTAVSAGRSPVLVELFTSEGCSSCPPADALLQKLDQQPWANAELIVLSEHVDYWNHLGWKDPYSARLYSERQEAYARRFGRDPYTPQMVVDGTVQFVGSDAQVAHDAVATAARRGKQLVQFSSITHDGAGEVALHLETGPLAKSAHTDAADVYVALALNQADSRVTAGENAGHRLTHVDVVQSMVRVGGITRTQPFAKDIRIRLNRPSDSHNFRIIAFVQSTGTGEVLGAVERRETD